MLTEEQGNLLDAPADALYRTALSHQPALVINFPTKGHWRSSSKLDDIREGLTSLREVIADHGIRSIAIPPLGCGHGGLDWRDVRPLIFEALDGMPTFT